MTNDPADDAARLTRAVIDRCRALGFALAGVARPEPTRWRDALESWLREGRHGEMAYLERHHEQRCDPRAMMPEVQAIICVADRYDRGGSDARPLDESRQGRIARYARGDDYHVSMKRRLHRLCDDLAESHPDASFRACVDTAPVLEREHAQRAGLGAVGKHTLLIEPGVGSYLLLGEVLTSLPLAPTPSLEDHDPCNSCTRCIDACPTDAITPWSVDATKCISYLTIEHRNRIDEVYHAAMGDWIFGCDICQEVCPHNHPTRRSRAAPVHETYTPRRSGFDLLDVLTWNENDRREGFTRSALKRARLTMMKRNALIAAANVLAEHADTALRERIEAIASDEQEEQIVREAAQAALTRLRTIE